MLLPLRSYCSDGTGTHSDPMRLLSPLSRIGNKLELLLENSALGQMVTIIVHSTNCELSKSSVLVMNYVDHLILSELFEISSSGFRLAKDMAYTMQKEKDYWFPEWCWVVKLRGAYHFSN
uniref:uncharacterized protein LOC105350977 n=1 Tax=Fragaria vesca subsp. vesca TaxID=101020 RepID=UPI0005CB48AD|nr:PREDICTED: uncharacterized protein LOC105350977 [Fragaria vesca subsp. vesca]XP_011462457.1 PREDICTED: uncharacterized protein LOC105350977 [Fragaria vesca subsp. vesca]